MKKILLVNQGLSSNIGDKAILLALKKYFEDKGCLTEVAGFTHFENTEIKDIDCYKYVQERIIDLPVMIKWNIKMKNRLRNEMVKYAQEYDYVVVGGGQLIKSHCYFPYALDMWADFAEKRAKRSVLIAVGIDPSFSGYEKKIIQRAINKFDFFTVRDKRSKERAKFFFDKEVIEFPDVAFLLEKYFRYNSENKREDVVVMPFDYATYKYHFKNDKKSKEYDLFWLQLIQHILENNPTVKLMYTTAEDKRECFRIFEKLSLENQMKVELYHVNSVEDILKKFSSATDIYSARMHALILGMVAGAKVHSINISDKIESFEKEFILSEKKVVEYAKEITKELDKIFEFD